MSNNKLVSQQKHDRGAFHSFEKAYEIFSEQKDFFRIFDGFFLQTKEFSPKAYEIFWSEMPLERDAIALQNLLGKLSFFGECLKFQS